MDIVCVQMHFMIEYDSLAVDIICAQMPYYDSRLTVWAGIITGTKGVKRAIVPQRGPCWRRLF